MNGDSEPITTTTMSSDSQLLEDTVKSLLDEELYQKLKELGYDSGPIVPSSRFLYEKKFLTLVRSNYENGDGSEGKNSRKSVSREPSATPAERNATPIREVAGSRSSREPSAQPSEDVSPRSTSVPRRYTYLEKISPRSHERIIEEVLLDDSGASLRQRERHQEYVGRWSPAATVRNFTKPDINVAKKNHIWFYVIAVVLLLAAAAAIYVFELAPPDPYQLLEDDAEKHVANN